MKFRNHITTFVFRSRALAIASLHLTVLFFFSAAPVSFAQTFEVVKGDTVNLTDANGMRQGRWLITNRSRKLPGYTPDAVVEEVTYVDNRKEGIRRMFYPDGKIKNEVVLVNNVPKGFSRTWYPNGNISEEGNWKNGAWDGTYKYYYEDGKLCYEWLFREGKRDGEQKYFHPNGKLNYIGVWKDGNEAGVLREYNETGQLIAEKSYNEGKLDEAASHYFTPGVVDKKSDDLRASDLGTLNGFYSLKDRNGKVSKEGTFLNGQLQDGKQFHYNSDGKLLRTIVYKSGKIFQTLEEK